MTERARGVVYNRDKAKRINDFSGLRYGKITPTDIDAFLDFGGLVYVVIEVKGEGVPVPTGQRIAIERMVRKLDGGPSYAVAIICECPDGLDDVDVGACPVREVWYLDEHEIMLRYKGEAGRTVRSTVDEILEFRGLNYG